MPATKKIGFKKNSLARDILFWMALAGLVPFFILAIPEYFFAEKALIDAEKKSLQQALKSRASMVDEWLENVRRDLEFISNSNCVQGTCSHSCSTSGSETSCPFQNSVLKSHPAYRSIQAYDKDLSLISQAGDQENCFASLSPEQLRNFFEAGQNFQISKKYCYEDNHTILTVGKRVRHLNARKNSYIIAHLDLNDAIGSIDHKPFLDTGKFYILSRQGSYLYPPRTYSFLHREKSILNSTLLSSADEMFLEYEDFRNEPVFASFVPVLKTDWLLVKEVDKDVAIRWRFLFSSRTGVACLASLLIVFAISLLTSRRLTRPLRILAEGAKSISLTSNSTWSRAPSFSYREIDEVGTAFNEMQLRLQESEKEIVRAASMAAIGKFSAGIVHEIRSPLSSINLALQSMAKNQISANDKERVEICVIQARRLMRMLDQILSYGKPLELHPEELAFSELLLELHGLMIELFKEKKIFLSINIDAVENKPIWADRELILQALTNILDNAVHWSPVYSFIEIEAYPKPSDNQMMTIRIADMGTGFKEKTLEQIFQPFYSNRPNGIGLGLAITRKIVELHDGCITAANRKEGGAEIFITLPFSAEENV